MSARRKLLESLASTIGDYRQGEGLELTPQHVEKWITQFEEPVREPLLTELDYVLKKTYISKKEAHKFLSGLVRVEKLAGKEFCDFWRTVSFLDIQGGGNSQKEMLQVFGEVLEKECKVQIKDCGGDGGIFLYLDDVMFTGNRVRNDLMAWIRSDCPKKAEVHIVSIAFHRGGQFYAKNGIEEAAKNAGKEVKLTWWRCLELEDRKTYTDSADVLRPSSIPEDKLVQAYVKNLKYPPVLRKPGNVGDNKFFSSEDGRNLLEQEFLKVGALIRDTCPNLNQYQRPLGNMILETLGFGSMIVTFRNCPNNCPLALWVGDPWYPLFPRKTN